MRVSFFQGQYTAFVTGTRIGDTHGLIPFGFKAETCFDEVSGFATLCAGGEAI